MRSLKILSTKRTQGGRQTNRKGQMNSLSEFSRTIIFGLEAVGGAFLGAFLTDKFVNYRCKREKESPSYKPYGLSLDKNIKESGYMLIVINIFLGLILYLSDIRASFFTGISVAIVVSFAMSCYLAAQGEHAFKTRYF